MSWLKAVRSKLQRFLVPKVVLTKKYRLQGIKLMKEIYDKANLKVLNIT
jgi:hypothetical protein